MMTVCWLVGRPIGWLVCCCDKKGLRDWNGTQRNHKNQRNWKANATTTRDWRLRVPCVPSTDLNRICRLLYRHTALWTGFDTSQWPNHLNKAHKYLHKWLFYGYACVILWQTLALSLMFTHNAANEREAMLSVSIVLPTLSFIRINDLHDNEKTKHNSIVIVVKNYVGQFVRNEFEFNLDFHSVIQLEMSVQKIGSDVRNNSWIYSHWLLTAVQYNCT